jgi:hypothetical protein
MFSLIHANNLKPDMWLIALCTAVGAIYLYKKTAKTIAEVAIVCVPVTLISLIVMLTLSPWQIKLALLITLQLHASKVSQK